MIRDTQESLGTTDRGVVMYRRLLFEQIERVQRGEDPINTFRDPRANQCIALPVPWDRGYAWGYAKDGAGPIEPWAAGCSNRSTIMQERGGARMRAFA